MAVAIRAEGVGQLWRIRQPDWSAGAPALNECTWRMSAHGFVLESTFPIVDGGAVQMDPERPPAALQGEDFSLKKVGGERISVPTRPRRWARNAGGLSVAGVPAGTLFESYCGSRALALADSNTVLVSRGRHISTARFNHTILHSFLPQLLSARGETILHATCVILDGRAFVFAGASGMGKSTLAAGFAAQGATVFSEDILRVERMPSGHYVAHRSYPGARLRANSFLLPAEKRTNQPGRFGLPKHRVYVTEAESVSAPAPVGAIFFLRSGRTVSPRFSPIRPLQAIRPLLKSSFLQALPKESRSREAFLRMSRLAAAVPAFELRYKRSPEHFPALLRDIERFCATTGTS